MTFKPKYQSYKEKRRKNRIYFPLIVGGISVILISVGIWMIYLWYRGANIEIAFLNTPTPTPTNTATPLPPTQTPTITPIPSATLPPTEAPTATASAPFVYIVQSGDILSSIAEKFDVDVISIMIYNGMTNDSPLFPNATLTIPLSNSPLPTKTPLPANLRPGDVIEYFVMPGDSAPQIAELFASTVEDIERENIDFYGADFNINLIFPGQILKVPVGRMTPTPTFGPPATDETAPSATPSLTPTP